MIKGDINQAKVNKCLIALVNRKVVQKNPSPVSFYRPWLDGACMLILQRVRVELYTDGVASHRETGVNLFFQCAVIIFLLIPCLPTGILSHSKHPTAGTRNICSKGTRMYPAYHPQLTDPCPHKLVPMPTQNAGAAKPIASVSSCT